MPPGRSFSVVIPAHNHASTIAEAVASALGQTIAPLEVVVVDGGSADATAERISAIRDPRLRLIVFPQRKGANAARNAGIAASSGDLVAFLDADDVYVADRLAEADRMFREDPGLAAVHCSFVTQRGKVRKAEIMPDIVLSGAALEAAMVGHCVALTNSAVVARRPALAAIGNFDETLFRQQDRDLLLRLAAAGSVAFTSFPGLIKRQMDNSMSRSHRNYIAGLDGLVGKHPVFLRPENAPVLNYLTARMLIKAVLSGDFAAARHEWHALKESRHLPKSLAALAQGYRAGRRERHRLIGVLRGGAGSRE